MQMVPAEGLTADKHEVRRDFDWIYALDKCPSP